MDQRQHFSEGPLPDWSQIQRVDEHKTKDLKGAIITIQEKKTSSKPKIRLNENLASELSKFIQEKGLKGEDFLFSSEITKHSIKSSLMSSPMLTDKEKDMCYGAHCFRVTAYNLARKRTEEEADRRGAEQLGHTNVRTGRKHYKRE